MPLIQGNAKSADAGGFYDTEISQSLRFNDDDSAYLSRTPASSGNLTTWTYSTWVKRGTVGGITNALLSSATTSDGIYISSNSNLVFYTNSNYYAQTAAVFRDPSAWYHIVCVWDTTNATSADRIRIYVNGERQSLAAGTEAALNATSGFNNNVVQAIGRLQYSSNGYHDGYLTEVNFIDGQALDPTSFGEFKSGVWIPKAYEGSYGTNGFYLPFEAGGSPSVTGGNFAQTTYTGTGASQNINIGFKPDLIWTKVTSKSDQHVFTDSVRGVNSQLYLDLANAAGSGTTVVTSINNDGFTVGSSPAANESGQNYIAMCWSAGGGSGSSNTDGSITSTVQADNGFSVCRYTANGTDGATFGHGLSSAPKVVLFKSTDDAENWYLSTENVTGTNGGNFRVNGFFQEGTGVMSTTAPDSSVVTLSSHGAINNSGHDMIAYCWADVTGYQKFGTYTGNASSSGPTVTTGFRPSLVITFRMDNSDYTQIHSGALDATNPVEAVFYTNVANAAGSTSNSAVDFNSDGFQIKATDSGINASGETYMYWAFADATVFNPIGGDESGNANHFDVNNLDNTDIVLDSPTNNFATLNSLAVNGTTSLGASLSEGNLRHLSSSEYKTSRATIPMFSGKWYAEAIAVNISGAIQGPAFGVTTLGHPASNHYINYDTSNKVSSYGYNPNGTLLGQSTTSGDDNTGGLATYTYGDIIAYAFDADTNELKVYKNNSLQATKTVSTPHENLWAFAASGYAANQSTSAVYVNFGQDSSFAGNKTAQGNTDANGYGDFYYAPPSGYLALCTANLSVAEAFDPALDASPQDYFNTVLYTGTGSSQSITGVGFQPDFVWAKARSIAYSNRLADVVRGPTLTLLSNSTDAESTDDIFDSFDSDGFTLGTDAGCNQSGKTYVAWNWKANGSGVSNTDGSITSTVSANTDAGFSIVKYVGNGSGGTVGHGLSQTPDCIITKNRTNDRWVVWHSGLGGALDSWLELHTTATAFGNSDRINNVNSSTFQVYSQNETNGTQALGIMAYCWHSVDGFSKFGTYTGNAQSYPNTPFIYTGFRPAFVLYKRKDTATSNWWIQDGTRSPYNLIDDVIYADLSNAEDTASAYVQIDFLSNGFKLGSNWGGNNGSGHGYVYMAFAENPFKYANAR